MRIKGRKQKKERAAAIQRGRKLLATQQVQEGHTFLQEAVQRFPDDPEIRLLYASILLAIRPSDVAAEAAKAVELGPDDPVILVRAAHLLLGRGEVEAARAHLNRAKKRVKPGFILMSGVVNLEGRLAAVDGRDDLAEKKFRAAVASDPALPALAIDLAGFLANQGRQEEALEVLDDALTHTEAKDELKRIRAEIVEGR